jgi:hypothetical protein
MCHQDKKLPGRETVREEEGDQGKGTGRREGNRSYD